VSATYTKPARGRKAATSKALAHAGGPPRWRLETPGGVRVTVPASLDLITPYVLLEQEDWFEDEIGFVRRLVQPGWHVLDIGANYGLYALTMAAAVGPTGRVTAFEPSASTAACLEASRSDNGFDQLRILPYALADRCGTAVLASAQNTELGALQGGGPTGTGEPVKLSTLDALADRFTEAPVRFVKMDAEGSEVPILDGGDAFLGAHDPVIMVEIKHGDQVNYALVDALVGRGYGLYRVLPGLQALVATDPAAPLDGYQLNLFAVSEARAAELAHRELLVRTPAADEPAADLWFQRLFAAPWAAPLLAHWQGWRADAGPAAWQAHARAMNDHALASDPARPLPVRAAALARAAQSMRALVADGATPARLCTAARILMDAGERVPAVNCAKGLVDAIASGRKVGLDEPFLAVSARYEALAPGARFKEWFIASLYDLLVRRSTFSTYFARAGQDRLVQQALRFPTPDGELARRLALMRLRQGRPAGLSTGTAGLGGRNAAVWRELLAGGTPA
jgi:FkbM family methyltransferase